MSDEFNNSGVVGEVVTQSTMSDKSKVVAALLSLFLGMFGIRRFYLGRVGSGVAMLICTVLGWLTAGIIIGFGLLIIIAINSICIYDLQCQGRVVRCYVFLDEGSGSIRLPKGCG